VFGALPQLNDVTQPDENPTQWVHSQTKSKTVSARLKAMIAKPFKSILPGRRNGEGSLRHTLEEIIEESQRSEDAEPIAENERNLLLNILKLRDLTAEDVMVPRADIVAASADINLEELIGLMSKEAHSRIPIFREHLDDVIGFVHMKDVISSLTGRRTFNIKRVMRNLLIVAPSMRVHDLLLQMRLTRVHMAMVVDEFGGIDGLVTIEDLIETIVGEIEDEHETEASLLRASNDQEIIASARATVDELEAMLGPILTEEEREDDIDTLGGLVAYIVGRVPSRSEIILHDSGLSFEVLEADPRRIKRLRITNVAEVRNRNAETGGDTESGQESLPPKPGAPAIPGTPEITGTPEVPETGTLQPVDVKGRASKKTSPSARTGPSAKTDQSGKSSPAGKPAASHKAVGAAKPKAVAKNKTAPKSAASGPKNTAAVKTRKKPVTPDVTLEAAKNGENVSVDAV